MKFMDRHERQTDMSETENAGDRLYISYVTFLY